MKKCSKLSQSDLVHDEVTCGLVQPSPSQPPGPDWTHLFPQLLPTQAIAPCWALGGKGRGAAVNMPYCQEQPTAQAEKQGCSSHDS